MKYNAPLNAVTSWVLNCCESKIRIRFKRQLGRCQIAFSALLCHVYGLCQQLGAGEGTDKLQFGLAGR